MHNHQPLLACPITGIRGVFLFEKGHDEEKFVAYSPPGHLLHLTIEGGVRQSCSGREYKLRQGDLLWYHENEFVEGICEHPVWRFYSVVFDAPSLPPPDFERRLSRPERGKAEKLFSELFDAWTEKAPMERGPRRALRAHAALSQLLLLHNLSPVTETRASPDHWLRSLWWNVENHVRQNLGRAYPLEELAAIGKVSAATIHRASMLAVHLSPVRRIKLLRLEMGRGLLVYSHSSIAEIAEKIGFERINEFSRDFRKAFGIAPSELRRKLGTE